MDFDLKTKVGEDGDLILGQFHDEIAGLVLGFERLRLERDDRLASQFKTGEVRPNDHRVLPLATSVSLGKIAFTIRCGCRYQGDE